MHSFPGEVHRDRAGVIEDMDDVRVAGHWSSARFICFFGRLVRDAACRPLRRFRLILPGDVAGLASRSSRGPTQYGEPAAFRLKTRIPCAHSPDVVSALYLAFAMISLSSSDAGTPD